MTAEAQEPIDAIAVWVEKNSRRAASDSVQLTLQQGHVPDGSRKKATLGLQAGEKVALIEVWSSGEMDFTFHDFVLGDEGQTTHTQFKTFQELIEAIERCYTKLAT